MIDSAYRDLSEALAEHSPGYQDFLPPATAAEIETAAAYFDIPPTSDLLTWWRLTAGTTTDFINDYRLLGALETIEATQWFRDISHQADPHNTHFPEVGWSRSWVVFGRRQEPLVVDAGSGGDDTIWFADFENMRLPVTIATVLAVWTDAIRDGIWYYDTPHRRWEHGPRHTTPIEIWQDRLLY